MGSREKVLDAATAMLAEDVTARLSVRTVAARAGVSTGSLRFHFPTQRELQEAVLERAYADLTGEDPIADSSLPAAERLVRCLQQLLVPTGVGADARANVAAAYRAFVEPEPTAAVRAAFAASERIALGRIEHWLAVLADEGATSGADRTGAAAFLLTVVNGLMLDRAMPRDHPSLATERRVLETAVAAVLTADRPT